MPNTSWSSDMSLGSCPALLLCEGKDCRKPRAFDDLRSRANDEGLALAMVKCQGSCKGPTAVVTTDDGPRWFESLQCDKAQRDLVAFAAGEASATKRLTKRELTGKRRAKAEKKLSKQLRRSRAA